MKSILWSDHLSVSATKRNLILSTFGKAGQNWLNELEATHIDAVHHWGLTFVSSLPSELFFICRVNSDKFGPAVLKSGVPDESFQAQISATSEFSATGAVRVFDDLPSKGLLLMEDLNPGIPLSETPELKAREIFCTLLRPLKKQKTPTRGQCDYKIFFDEAGSVFQKHKHKGTVDSKLIDSGQTILKTMKSMPAEVQQLCHGDLHQQNILSHGNEWKIIDPKGVIAPFEFELAAFIRNGIPETATSESLSQLLNERVCHFAHSLDLSGPAILRSGFVSTLLATLYGDEDDSPVRWRFEQVTNALFQMLSHD